MRPIITVLLILSISLSYAQVGIGTSTPENSSALEVKSSTKGFLPPRLDNTKRATINNPAQGLIIYNTEENCLQINLSSDLSNSDWVCLGLSTQAPTSPKSRTLLPTLKQTKPVLTSDKQIKP